MSTDYTETLKKIKETEEATSRELLERRKHSRRSSAKLEEESAAEIAEAKMQGESHVASEVEKARKAGPERRPTRSSRPPANRRRRPPPRSSTRTS